MKALIQNWIEGLYEQGLCSRLMIDATVEGVEVPDWVKEQWAEALPIDLDPNYPLDLRYEDEGLYCCLSFGGPWDCFFPWRSIYLVQDRDTQVGVLIDQNLPKQLQIVTEEAAKRRAATEPEQSNHETALREMTGDALPIEQEEPAESKRARFRVIDGGKR